MRFILKLLVLISLTTAAAGAVASKLQIDDVRAAATYPMAETAAVYLTLTNTGDTPRLLKSVSVDAAVAKDAQLHTTEMDGDMMRMREVSEGLTISPGDSQALTRGGYHIMLMGLKNALAAGENFALTLRFNDGETVTTQVRVTPADTGRSEHKHRHNH